LGKLSLNSKALSICMGILLVLSLVSAASAQISWFRDISPRIDNVYFFGNETYRWGNGTFQTLFVDDWSNVSITESQISDLQTYQTGTELYNITGDFQSNLYISNCSSSQLWKDDGSGNMVCSADIDTNIGNSTAEIWGVVDNSTFLKIVNDLWNTTSDVWSVVYNGTFQTGSELYNTTADIWKVVDNSTFRKVADDLYNTTFPCGAITGNTSDLCSIVDTDTNIGNSTAEIWGVVDNSTFRKIVDDLYNTTFPCGALTGNTSDLCSIVDTDTNIGNSTAEIWSVVDNSTFVKMANDLYNTTGDFQANLYISNCTSGNIWKADAGGDMICGADTTGSGGVGVWMATGGWTTPNETAGGTQNVNITGYMNASQFQSSADRWCNTTECYTLEELLADVDMWNTTSQIWAVVDNSTFVKIGNDLYNTTFPCGAITGNTSDLCSIVDTDTNIGNSSVEISTVINATGVPYSAITGHPADLYNTTEEIQDTAGGLWTGNTEDGVDVTYQTEDNTLDITFDCSDVVGTGLTCSGEDIITNLADAQVPDDITLTSTHNISTTGWYILNANSTGTTYGNPPYYTIVWNGTCLMEINLISGNEVWKC
jgi:hypothetical protein